jgi:hypothetical protein
MSLLIAFTLPFVLQHYPENWRQFNSYKSAQKKNPVLCSSLYFSLKTSSTFFEVVSKHDIHNLNSYTWTEFNSIAPMKFGLKNEGLLRISPSYPQVRKWNIGLIQVQNILFLYCHILLPLVREFLIILCREWPELKTDRRVRNWSPFFILLYKIF